MSVQKFPEIAIYPEQGAPSGALLNKKVNVPTAIQSFFGEFFGDGESNSYNVRDHVVSANQDWLGNRVQQFRNLTLDNARIIGNGPYICIGVQRKLVLRGANPRIQLNGTNATTNAGAVGRGGNGGTSPTAAQDGNGGLMSTSGISNPYATNGIAGGAGGTATLPFSLAGGGGGGGGCGDNNYDGGGGGGGGIGGAGGLGTGGVGTAGGIGNSTSNLLQFFYLLANGNVQANGSTLASLPITKGGVLGWGGGGGGGGSRTGGEYGGGGGAGGGGIYIEANEVEIDPALIGSGRLTVNGGNGHAYGWPGDDDGGGGGGGGGGSIFIVCNKCNLTPAQLVGIMRANGGNGGVIADPGGGDGGNGGVGTRACYIFQQ